MVDGLQNSKIAFIIQARMQSTRLPGKILIPLPLGSNKPLLSWIVDELKTSTHSFEIFIATSKDESNDVLERYCNDNKISIFRGSENDVLSRFISILKTNNYSNVIRLTADNPIIDISVLDGLIDFHLQNKNDYSYTDSMPTGMNFEAISSSSLLSLENKNLTNLDREHVTLYIRNSGEYNVCDFKVDLEEKIIKLRLTVDYPSDFSVVSNVLSYKLHKSNLKGLELIKSVYNTNPWLFELNKTNFQKIQFKSIEDEVVEAIKVLNHLEFNNSASMLKAQLEKKES